MKNLCLFLAMALVLFACDQNNHETPEPTDFGYLSMNIVLSIEEVPATGRIEAVSTDDWSVTIFNASDDSEVINFTPFIDAPTEVQLPTGEYYVEAHSNNFAAAAFENPYYFGRSENFTIDKEELKTIDIDAELANSKVAINYSPNVTSTFNSYSGTVTVVGTTYSLTFDEDETRDGYFVSAPLAVEVNLSYTKLNGEFITRQFTADIDAQPKTLYNINVDATLEDGEIMINLNVDEGFEEVIINLTDNSQSSPCRFEAFDIGTSPGNPIQIIDFIYSPSGSLEGMTINSDGEIFATSLTFDSNNQLVRLENQEVAIDFFYNSSQQLIEEIGYESDGMGGFGIDNRKTYAYNDDGQLVQRLFYNNDGSGNYVIPGPYDIYTYANSTSSNPTKQEYHQQNGTITEVLNYTYDSNPNPVLEVNVPWTIFNFYAGFSDNNIAKIQFQEFDFNSGDLTEEYETNMTYTYNNDGYPLTAEYADDDGFTLYYSFEYNCE